MSAERVTSRPIVSIVVPAYRSEATIAKSLRSLENQTYASFELIVVDSSPDETTASLVT